jgi:hypothetical protein
VIAFVDNGEKVNKATLRAVIFLSNVQARIQRHRHPVVRPRNDWNHREMADTTQANLSVQIVYQCHEKLTLIEIIMISISFY